MVFIAFIFILEFLQHFSLHFGFKNAILHFFMIWSIKFQRFISLCCLILCKIIFIFIKFFFSFLRKIISCIDIILLIFYFVIYKLSFEALDLLDAWNAFNSIHLSFQIFSYFYLSNDLFRFSLIISYFYFDFSYTLRLES